jgi:hypothetical protein
MNNSAPTRKRKREREMNRISWKPTSEERNFNKELESTNVRSRQSRNVATHNNRGLNGYNFTERPLTKNHSVSINAHNIQKNVNFRRSSMNAAHKKAKLFHNGLMLENNPRPVTTYPTISFANIMAKAKETPIPWATPSPGSMFGPKTRKTRKTMRVRKMRK